MNRGEKLSAHQGRQVSKTTLHPRASGPVNVLNKTKWRGKASGFFLIGEDIARQKSLS